MAIITISRMYGSSGSLVARRTADALGWHLLDNDLVDAVARRMGVARSEVSQRDERVPSLVERLAAALTLSAPEVLPGLAETAFPPSEEQVVQVTRLVIEEAVLAGHAVLVGRGAQCLLANRPDALHVFCYADHASLVAHAMVEHSLAPADAERTVAAMNHQREQYVRRHWHRDWRAVENYDLCINIGAVGIDGAVDLVLHEARRRFS